MSEINSSNHGPDNYTFKEIPIIDLTTLSTPNADLRSLAAVIRDACINVGFFYVKNHGIPDSTIQDALLPRMKDFFELPIEEKMLLENKKNPSFMGYSSLLSGNNDPNGNGDLHEGFEFGWEPKSSSSNILSNGPKRVGNVWPETLPKFRDAALDYYHAAVQLGKSLFPLFALALDLPEDFFDDKTRHSAALMRLLHYPPQSGPVDDRVIGIGAHTEYSQLGGVDSFVGNSMCLKNGRYQCFTILWQEPDIQALQVLNNDKHWIDAPPVPGTLVVNLGDQFARWTNDTFKSTVHRAINRSGTRRYSIPLFFGTDNDVPLEPIPGCTSPTRPYAYDVITAGEYVRARLEATYGH